MIETGAPRGGWWKAVALLAVLAAVSVVGAAPRERVTAVQRGGQADTVVRPRGGGPAGGNLPGQSASGQVKAGGPQLACAAGRNGDVTDVGVTATTIRLGATVVESGPGRTFLADVRHAINAVANKVNAEGGICGRRLELIMRDDGWDPNRGRAFIRNLVEDSKVFALAVVPSSEGLRAASRYLLEQRVPVVGTDGMLGHQYTNPIIWPVSAATITAMHVMAADAHTRGARKFGIVYDSNYRFGIEGAYAFNAAFRRLTGRDIPGYSDPLRGVAQCRDGSRFCGVQAGKESYATQVEVFNRACRECDYIAYLLEPQTALQWMRDGGLGANRAAYGVGGPQPLFNRHFAAQCGARCHGMRVWTGYIPPIEPFTRLPAVARFVADIRRTNAATDVNNSFVEGGYVGMSLLVDALRRVGPNLTRSGLIAALDSATLDMGLSRPLTWRSGNHFANQCLLAFEIQSKPFFAGWRKQTDWQCDRWPGRDIPVE